MSYRDFCYWLQGFFELVNPENISQAQLAMIQSHRAMINPLMGEFPQTWGMYRNQFHHFIETKLDPFLKTDSLDIADIKEHLKTVFRETSYPQLFKLNEGIFEEFIPGSC